MKKHFKKKKLNRCKRNKFLMIKYIYISDGKFISFQLSSTYQKISTNNQSFKCSYVSAKQTHETYADPLNEAGKCCKYTRTLTILK